MALVLGFAKTEAVCTRRQSVVTTHADGYTEFLFFRPNVKDVFLTGDFNRWRSNQLRMVPRPGGYWALRLLRLAAASADGRSPSANAAAA